jgi:hypothetical protein
VDIVAFSELGVEGTSSFVVESFKIKVIKTQTKLPQVGACGLDHDAFHWLVVACHDVFSVSTGRALVFVGFGMPASMVRARDYSTYCDVTDKPLAKRRVARSIR